jgi:hypothetical protein
VCGAQAELPWTTGLAQLVAAFVDHRRSRHRQEQQHQQGARAGDGGGGGGGGGGLRVYFREDVEGLFDAAAPPAPTPANASAPPAGARRRRPLLCFERLVVFGALDLALPFLATTDEADAFRQFTYTYMGLPPDPKSGPPPLPSPHPPYGAHGGRGPRAPEEGLGPNDPLRVTVVLRPTSRRLRNLDALLRVLRATGAVDLAWLDAHARPLEGLGFRAQVARMRGTDVLITPHGAALTNVVFLPKHSAVIELFTSPWYEPGYQPTALVFSVHYQVRTPPRLQRRGVMCF